MFDILPFFFFLQLFRCMAELVGTIFFAKILFFLHTFNPLFVGMAYACSISFFDFRKKDIMKNV